MKLCPFRKQHCREIDCAIYDNVAKKCCISNVTDALWLQDCIADKKSQAEIISMCSTTISVKRFFALNEELFAFYKKLPVLTVDFSEWCEAPACFDTYLSFENFIKEEFNEPQTVLDTAMLSNTGYFRFEGIDGWEELPYSIKFVDG